MYLRVQDVRDTRQRAAMSRLLFWLTHSTSPAPPSLLGTGPVQPVLGGSTLPLPPPPLPFCCDADVELSFFGAIVGVGTREDVGAARRIGDAMLFFLRSQGARGVVEKALDGAVDKTRR